ncbi:MAG: transposase [Desulfobacterales bacterium]|jgi:REP element-mobilizing transposase RayT|nr:transposase [Desulfobacterales bacterium]MCU0604634.1 transposase [Desulfobacterales bacterium]
MTGGSHQLRRGRASIANQAYFITTAVYERIPVFANPQAANIVLNALKWLEQTDRMKLDAAIVMPDHIHFIAALKNADLPKLMQSLKGYTSRAINTLMNKKGAFWQDQYHEHAIRKDEVLNEVVLYMLHNPVRAGLVKDFHDYPFWYCRWSV